MNNMYHVIMCGGVGSRFWPMSTSKVPKQFLKLVGNKSLFRLTIDRLLEISDIDKIIIVTSKKYKDLILEESPEIPTENILCEPSPRNTAPAIYLASKFIQLKDNDAVVGVYPADHYIKDIDAFNNSIMSLKKFIISDQDSICTLGIKPSYPSTSYGYIECMGQNINGFYKISSFKEKPNLKLAKELIKKDNFLWNSGMFFFNVSKMLNEIDNYQPEINRLYELIDYNENNISNKVSLIWNKMPKISIDYAVMEKSNEIYCMESEFGWSDLGTWVSLYELLEKDNNNNHHEGDVLIHDSKNNLVISDNQLVSIVGLSNIGVINHNGKILVIDLEKSEEVRYIISQLNNKDK